MAARRKNTTLADVADEAGVSPMTASRALRAKGRVKAATREKVLQAARELGYLQLTGGLLPITRRTTNSDHVLRVVVPVVKSYPEPVTEEKRGGQVLKGLKSRLAQHGGDLILLEVDSLEKIESSLPSQAIHGIVLRYVLPKQYSDGLARHARLIYAISQDYTSGVDAIYFNEYRMAGSLLDYLTSHGHRDIAWVSFLDGSFDYSGFPRQAFESGWSADLHGASISGVRNGAWASLAIYQSHQKMPMVMVDKSSLQTLAEIAAHAADQILALRPRPTGLIVKSGEFAQALIREFASRNVSIPKDFSMVCIDSQGRKRNLPAVTGTILPFRQIGETIPDLLHRSMGDPKSPPISIQFEAGFFEGNTVKRLNPASQ